MKNVSLTKLSMKKRTVVWYVDNNKASHVYPKSVDNLLEIIIINFEEITITRGKKHSFLGMNIQIIEDKTIEIEIEE